MRISDGVLPGIGNQLGHGVHGYGRMYDQHRAALRDDRQRPQIRLRVEGQMLVKRRVRRQRRVERDQQCVSVRRRAGDELRRKIAACAGSVVHHECLLEIGRQIVRHGPRDEIVRAACRPVDDDLDRSLRIGLRRGSARGGDDAAGCRDRHQHRFSRGHTELRHSQSGPSCVVCGCNVPLSGVAEKFYFPASR
jgi:hypothetical protein